MKIFGKLLLILVLATASTQALNVQADFLSNLSAKLIPSTEVFVRKGALAVGAFFVLKYIRDEYRMKIAAEGVNAGVLRMDLPTTETDRKLRENFPVYYYYYYKKATPNIVQPAND